MKKIKLGNTGLSVSPVGFGVLTVGATQLNMPVEQGAGLIKYALSKGINFFDTAQYYETYPYLRMGLENTDISRSNPDRPVICSKCLGSTYNDMEYAINEALRELNTDIIDIFLLHEVRSEQDYKWRDGALQCLKDYKAKGSITAIGLSTHHVDVTELAASEPDIDVVFPLINYAGLGIRHYDQTGTAEDMAAAIAACHKAGKGVFAMKAFGGGNLTGSYVKALEYVRDLDGVDSIMVGIGDYDQIDRLAEFAEGTLDRNYVPDLSGKKMFIEPGNCITCGACADRCPNNAITMGSYMAEIDHSICLTCGYCAPVCPVRALIML